MPPNSNHPTPLPEQYSIVLPCDPPHFQDFISGLLGKPQTITRNFGGPFDLKKHEIANFHYLVLQRVTQQNEATLIQFSARIVYDDNSSVLVNSISDFESYNEVRPLISLGVHLSWTFLVKFLDRDVPEKQQIDVSIRCPGTRRAFDEDAGFYFEGATSGMIGLRVQHTARTWGSDIEALLGGHIGTLLQRLNPVRLFFLRHHNKISGFTMGGFFLAAVLSSLYATNQFLHSRIDATKALAKLDPSKPETVTKKVDYIIDSMATGMWPRFFYYVGFFLLLSLIAAVSFGMWVDLASAKWPPSFLVLSRQAETAREEWMSKHKHVAGSWLTSIVVSIVTGVIADYLFAYYFQNWRP